MEYMRYTSKKKRQRIDLKSSWISFHYLFTLNKTIMSKLEKLTPEQESQMQVFRDKYIENFKSCKRPEKRKIKK